MPSGEATIQVWIRDWGLGTDPRKRAYVVDDPMYNEPANRKEQPETDGELPKRPAEYEDIYDEREKVRPPPDSVSVRSVDTDAVLGLPFATSVANRVGARGAVDRTAAADQITGKVYTDKRREELQALLGRDHYLLREYGMRTIKDMTKVSERPGLRIDHSLSSTYLRDAPDQSVRDKFADLYQTKTGNAFVPGKMFVVNSEGVPDKLTAIYGPDWTDVKGSPPLTFKSLYAPPMQKIADGVWVLTMSRQLNSNQKKAFQGRMLDGLGATPSSYQAVKALAPGAQPPLTDPNLLAPASLGNGAKVGALKTAPGITVLKSLPKSHPMATLGNAAAQMVEGLAKKLEAKTLVENADAFNRNKLVAAALKNIDDLMAAMPSYMDDIPRFTRLFDVLVDEVYLVLATCKPYTKQDFKDESKAMMEQRAPALKTIPNVKNETFLLSSGMDTLSTAVMAAKSLTSAQKVNLLDPGSPGSPGVNYFEIQVNMLSRGKVTDNGPLIMGTLNPSTPNVDFTKPADSGWDVDDLITQIETKVGRLAPGPTALAPAVVVIDVTVEQHKENDADKEINKIILKFKKLIDEQKMQIMLCKSYQKYPSLGTGKAMSGGLTVIGKGPKCEALMTTARDAETKLAFDQNDETQMVAHFMTHERDMETPMLDRAQTNAAFLKGMMPGAVQGPQSYKYSEGLPFLVVSDAPRQFTRTPTDAAFKPDDLLYKLGVEQRFSFGFQNSSCLDIPGGVRICTGQESKAELVEKFYAFTRLSTATGAVDKNTIKGYALNATDLAFKDAKPMLLKGKGSEPWRINTARALVKAGMVEQSAIAIDAKANGGNGKLTKFGDATEESKIDQALEAALALLERPPSAASGGVPAPKLLRARLSLLDSATTVQMDDETRLGSDANVMHASLKRVWKADPTTPMKLGAEFLPNIVASCAMLMGTVFDAPGEVADFTVLADPLIDNGLDQLSPEMRERLLGQRARAELASGIVDVGRTAEKIAQCVDKMPYREGGARLLQDDAITEALTGRVRASRALSDVDTDKLTSACTAQLDLASHTELLATLIKTATAAKQEQPRLRTEATRLRRLVPRDSRARGWGPADRAAANAEAAATEQDILVQAPVAVAKSCARGLRAELQKAQLAMSTTTKPIKLPRLGTIALDGGRTKPEPMTAEDFRLAKQAAEAQAALADRL